MNTKAGASGPDPRGRTLKWLAVAALVTSLAAVIAHSLSGGKTDNGFSPRLAFPGFETTMADTARIEIQSKDAHFTVAKITVAKVDGEDHWGVAERGNYPIRAEELKALMWGLGDMELIEKKTARAERHQAVGLGAPEDGGDGVRIRVLSADNTVLAAALFGNPEGAATLDGKVRTWLRMDGEDQTWIGEGHLEIEAALEEWLDLDFLEVDASRIASVHTTPGATSQGGEAFSIARSSPESYNFELLDLYDGEAMSGPTVANGLGRALIAMTFSDAMPAGEIGFDDAAFARYETFDGLALTLRVQRFEENFWTTVEAETFEPDEMISATGADETEDAPKDVTAEAARINARAAGWAFQIPEWKGDQLTIARTSMIK